MEKHPLNISTPSCVQHAILIQKYRQHRGADVRRLVLLHGAGVAGETTWMYLVNYLEEWDEILIPDFAGMGGKSRFLDIHQPAINDYARQIQELLIRLEWHSIDIAGYSFGGMVTHGLMEGGVNIRCAYLIEPAMLFSDQADQLKEKARQYRDIAQQLIHGESGQDIFIRFLDSVSPQRINNETADRMTVKRLRANSEGFARSLQAVSDEIEQRGDYFLQWTAPWPGVSFVGGLTPAFMHQRHQRLAQESSDWSYESVPSSDHSLVFTKPRTIAAVMNRHRARMADSDGQ
ncbi:MAG: hypothetical protein CMI02_16810 [Oceanospirillaceae bacterium]|nr:hypothetical protein [Oceanospirillaceae bacterium]MBT13683.1 hypothetical protein [Oceanospirillaceae bacterium]|tara:strand:- start:45799 stop:46668 length:870 start_codon:yes stop_codon:yes gene_type:complete